MFEYFETWFGYLRTGYKTSVTAFKTRRLIWKQVQVTVEQPLHFVLEENLSYWTIGGVGLGTRICCQWHVTNSTHREIVILKARISGHDARHSEVLTECGLGVGPHLSSSRRNRTCHGRSGDRLRSSTTATRRTSMSC